MRWIKEVEMATTADDLETFRSIFGYQFPNFEMLDAKITSVLKKSIQNANFKKRVCLEEHKAQKDDRFLRKRQIAFTIYEHFRYLLLMQLFSITLIDSVQLYMVTTFMDLIPDGDDIILSIERVPSDDILESLKAMRM